MKWQQHIEDMQNEHCDHVALSKAHQKISEEKSRYDLLLSQKKDSIIALEREITKGTSDVSKLNKDCTFEKRKLTNEFVVQNKLVSVLKNLKEKRKKKLALSKSLLADKTLLNSRLNNLLDAYEVLKKEFRDSTRQGKLFRREIEMQLISETNLRIHGERAIEVITKEHDKVVLELKNTLANKVELEIMNKRYEMLAVVNKEAWHVESDKLKETVSEEAKVRMDLECALDFSHVSFQKRALKWSTSRRDMKLEIASLSYKQAELSTDLHQREQEIINVTAAFESKLDDQATFMRNKLNDITASRDKTNLLLKRLSRKLYAKKKSLSEKNVALQNEVVLLNAKVDKRSKRTLEVLALCNLHKEKYNLVKAALEALENNKVDMRNHITEQRVISQVKQQKEIENMVLDVRKEEVDSITP